ncbi:MAG: flavodoxin family protein [Dehalococcoidales bacterium]|nr:flavodoxin family protein [Dehalococcoidales bacterium]
MKIIGISGSPRRGNTEWMVKELLARAAESGVETELILLRQKKIKPCCGCLSCEEGGVNRKGVCRLRDDMQELYPKLIAADGWVVGTPVYFEMLSGLLKNFMDRTCPIWPRLSGKPVAGIAVAEEGIGKAISNIRTYVSLCQMRWMGSVTGLATKPGEIAGNKRVKKRLDRLIMKLIRGAQS